MPVYQYEGLHYDLPDGLTNEQAISKIEAHLGKSSKTAAPSVPVGDGEGLLDKAVGLGQAGATALTGAAGMLAAPVVGGIQYARSKMADVPTTFEKEYADVMERMTYEPSREKGKEYAGHMGEAINRYLIPASQVAQGIPYANTLSAGLKGMGKAVEKVAPVSRHEAALADLAAKPEAAIPTSRPGETTYTILQQEKQQLLSKEKLEPTEKARLAAVEQELLRLNAEEAVAKQKETQLAQQSAFNRPPTLMEPTVLSPMESMARDLGAEIAPKEVPPLTGMAAELTRGPLEPRAAIDAQDAMNRMVEGQKTKMSPEEAQAAVEARQRALESQVKQDTPQSAAMPFERDRLIAELTAERTKQEHASPYSPEHLAMKAKEQVLIERLKALDEETARLGDLEKAQAERQARQQEGQLPAVPDRPLGEGVGTVPKTKLSEPPLLRQAPNGELLRTEAPRETPTLPVKSTLESAGEKVAKGQTFALTAAEKVMWEKTKAAIQNVGEQFKKLSDHEIVNKMMNREWIADTVKKIRDKAKTFDEIAKREELRRERMDKDFAKGEAWMAQDRAIERAVQARDRLMEQAETLEQVLRERPDTSTKAQGPKTRAAKQEEMRKRFGKQAGFISFGNKGKADAMGNVPGLEALKKIGHALIESPAKAIELAQQVKDINQNALSKAFNYVTKGGEYLKARVDHPVVHYAVDTMLNGSDLAKSEVSQKLHGEYLPAIRALSQEEFIGTAKILDMADRLQKTITPEQMQKWGLSTKEQKAIEIHQRLMKEAGDRMNKVRELNGLKPIPMREAYSAMSFSGNYRKVVFKGEEIVGVITSDKLNGKFGWNLEKIEQSLKETNPEYRFGALQDRTKYSSTVKATPHEAFNDVLANLGSENPHISEFLAALKELSAKEEQSYMGMNKHMLQKKGVFGAEGRKSWLSDKENARELWDNQVKYLENSMNWGHLAEAATKVNEVLKDPSVLEKHKNAIAMAEEYVQRALGIQTSQLGHLIQKGVDVLPAKFGYGPAYVREAMRLTKMTINTALLSFNHVFLAMQMLQPIANMPGLAALLRGYGAAPGSTMATFGLGHLAQGHYTYMKAVLGKSLSEFESQALKYAKDNHIYSNDMVEHSLSTRKDLGYRTSKLAQAPMASVETLTRAQMFMGLVHMMKDAGVKEGLFEQAHRFTDMGMNRMDGLEKPKMYESLGPIGSAAYNLSSFKHNELSRWMLYADEIARSKNPVPLLTQMGTTLVMAGLIGIPFYSLAATVYSYITEKLGEPRSLLLDTMELNKHSVDLLGDAGTFALSNGLPGVFGVDLSKRLGLADVTPTNVADAAMPGISKLGSIISSTAKAAWNYDKSEYAKAMGYQLAPGSAQGPLDVAWYQKDDVAYSKDPDNLHSTARRTDFDTLMRKIGLTSMNEAVQKNAKFENDKIDQQYTGMRQKDLHALAQDIFNERDVTASLEKWVQHQGDPANINREIDMVAKSLELTPQEIKLVKDSASKSLTRMYSLQRRTQ